MSQSLVDVFRRLSRPMQPIATGETPRLTRLPGVRVVLFDIYGTLLISGSGEVGSVDRRGSDANLWAALEAVGIGRGECASDAQQSSGSAQDGDPPAVAGLLVEAIRTEHALARQQGVEFPEVDLREIWPRVVADLASHGAVDVSACGGLDVQRLAIEYEARNNPCWPMPGARQCLTRLAERGVVLGLVSNAQFYTPLLLEALLSTEPASWQFAPELRLFSYEHRHGKPGGLLFEKAVSALGAMSLSPGEALYVGNDMLNDVWPAQVAGFKTALFAGDARSLRWRQDDPRLAGVSPDVILTELAQLDEVVTISL